MIYKKNSMLAIFLVFIFMLLLAGCATNSELATEPPETTLPAAVAETTRTTTPSEVATESKTTSTPEATKTLTPTAVVSVYGNLEDDVNRQNEVPS